MTFAESGVQWTYRKEIMRYVQQQQDTPAPPPAMPTVLKKHVAAVHTSGELSLVERKVANIPSC